MVLFTITDAFIRRNQGQERGIGTLLGSISDGVVEVKNCYAVPHSESNEQVGAARRRVGRAPTLLVGTAPGKGAIVSFEMKGAHAHDVATVIDRAGVAVRAGTHCAMPLMTRFGVTSTCRASFALYNTRAEVDALVEALARAETLFA